jgi:hypothetical protein
VCTLIISDFHPLTSRKVVCYLIWGAFIGLLGQVSGLISPTGANLFFLKKSTILLYIRKNYSAVGVLSITPQLNTCVRATMWKRKVDRNPIAEYMMHRIGAHIVAFMVQIEAISMQKSYIGLSYLKAVKYYITYLTRVLSFAILAGIRTCSTVKVRERCAVES